MLPKSNTMSFYLVSIYFLVILSLILLGISFFKHKRIKELEKFPRLNPNFVFQLKSPSFMSSYNPSTIKYFGENIDWVNIDSKLSKVKYEEIVSKGLHVQHQVYFNNLCFLVDYVGSPKLGRINAYGTDITELNKLREEVYQSNKLAEVGVLAAGVGHEINNPLSIAISALNSLERKLNNHEQYKYIEIQRNSLLRIEKIVNGLRVYARGYSCANEIFSTHEAIINIFELLNEIYKKDSVSISLYLDAEDVHVQGSYGKFQQVIMNLISNAKDALEEADRKEIHISSYNIKNDVVIEVKDFGEGIPLENQSKIFDAFFTTKKIGKGTGLGLGISNKIILTT